ncbi:MAG TPA: hypothetical protein GX705_07835 [Clostridiales bacterium]|nr:hypothetical protein [Clostridiales bacterium]
MYGHRKERVHYEEILLWSRSIIAYDTKMDRINGSGSVKAVLRNGKGSSPSVRAYREGVFGFCQSRYYIRRQNESDTGQT